ncbi:MAG: M67 family peptidase [Candidatus Hydrogenedentota bacterium]|nr:MAG: M67 family peptidase [Candidatus Hydrogenedentota bacterium]
MRIIFSRLLWEDIRRHSAEGYPEEICGILIGEERGAERRVSRLVRAGNRMEENRRRRYLIEPLELARVERDADARGETLLGFYHSHPDHPPRPSETDLAWAWPFYSYVIQSVVKGEPKEGRCWRLREDGKGFREEEIVVE